MTHEYMTIEDMLWAAIQGKDVWHAPASRTDVVEMMRDTLVEWLREAEGRAAEFDHVERADQFRSLRQIAEELP